MENNAHKKEGKEGKERRRRASGVTDIVNPNRGM